MEIKIYIVSLICLFYVIISIVRHSLKQGISPYPSPSRVQKEICLFLNSARLIEGDFIDLGSGWGSVLRAVREIIFFKRKFGVEVSPIPYFFSKLCFYSKLNTEILRKNFFECSFRKASVVYCYLCPSLMSQLSDKFKAELREGAWIISYEFALQGWTPVKIIELKGVVPKKLYIYWVNSSQFPKSDRFEQSYLL